MHYSRPSDFEHFLLKEDAQAVAIDTGETCRLAALSMARQATRSIDIVSRQLDPQMYDNRDFCDALSQLITGSRRAQVRALLRHTDPVVKHGHRLVTLSQRFSSYIEIRVPEREAEVFKLAASVVEEQGGRGKLRKQADLRRKSVPVTIETDERTNGCGYPDPGGYAEQG